MKKATGNSDIVWRETPCETDEKRIKDIVVSSGFFSEDECEIAVELVQERLQKGISSGYHFLFVEEKEQMKGYACFGPIPGTKGSFDLYWIAVENSFRGFGLGLKIMEKVENKIAEFKGRQIYVETSSKEQYQQTRSFYEKCGYKKAAELSDFYSPGDNKIIYVKNI